MSIKKSSDGYYRTSITIDGKKYSVAAKTEAECNRKVGALKAKVESGTHTTKNMTVKAFCDEWLSVYRADGTQNDKRYEQIVRKVIVPPIGNRKMSSITERDLQKILNDNAGYSKSQLSKIRITMKQIWHKAYKNHIITDDPSEDLKLPQCSDGTHRALTDTEREAILHVAENHRAGLYVLIMLYCGLRPGEVDALQWKFVNMDEHIIYVRQAVKHASNEIGKPKSKAGIRNVPIPDILYSKLHEGKMDDFVCLNERGERHTKASRNRMWKSFLRDVDIYMGATVYRNQIIDSKLSDDLTLYCLRHTYCTDLQRAGVPVNIAKTLMGHEDISVTANIYTHTSDDDSRLAVEHLNEYLKPKV